MTTHLLNSNLPGLLLTAIVAGPAALATTDTLPDIPDSPVGKRLEWAIQAVRVGATVEPRDAFAEEFLEHIPRDAIIDSIAETSTETGGLDLVDVQSSSDFKLRAVMRARSDGSCWRIDIEVADEDPHGITRIVYDSDPALGVRYGDGWPRVSSLFEALPGEVTFVAYDLRGATLTPIRQLNADAVLAIGSTFKLWVLGALGERIGSGEVSWDDLLAIREDWKSLPSGTMQNLASGEKRTLREFAVKMISISDNTATDHLIHYLGRDKVAQFAATHGSPAVRNDPFLTTREFFKLKTVADPGLRGRYAAAKPQERARLLVESLAPLPLPLGSSESEMPLAIDKIEYFASAAAVSRLLVSLETMGKQPGLAPIWDALTEKRGIEWDRSRWPTVAYKGGSESGVLYTAWLMERDDGRRFVMCFGTNDPTAPVDTRKIIKILKAAGELLATRD